MKPVSLAFLAAVLWGLWWMPIRWLDGLGLGGAMAGLAMNAGAFAASAAWVLVLRAPVRPPARAALGAALVGVGVTLYSAALNHGDVVRVVLLFYLAPAWSKIIEWAFLGLPWRWPSSLALGAALGGAALILGGDATALRAGPGEVLALASGLAWAIGAALLFSGGRTGAAVLCVFTSLSAVATGLVFVWLAGTALPPARPLWAMTQGAGLGIGYILPVLALTVWSAQRLAPATLSFLLTAEIVVGVLSGVLLLDEPFGPWQALGAALIVLGALSEVLPGPRLSARKELT